MDDFTPGGEGGLPTRREFGRLLTRATILPVAFPLLGGASPAAPAAADRRCDYVPEDTYPYFTESDPATRPVTEVPNQAPLETAGARRPSQRRSSSSPRRC